jgi:hypothetical protein
MKSRDSIQVIQKLSAFDDASWVIASCRVMDGHPVLHICEIGRQLYPLLRKPVFFGIRQLTNSGLSVMSSLVQHQRILKTN